MNVIFQVIQNMLRRREHQAVCPGCGRPLPEGPGPDTRTPPDDDAGETDPAVRRCPECRRPLSGEDG